MLAVLGGLIAGSEADYLAHDIVPVLGSLGEIDAWTAARAQHGRRAAARIVHIDYRHVAAWARCT